MDKDTIKGIVENSRLSPGIHNYCDCWCERCPMTAHCAVFAMEQAVPCSPLSCDPENEAFWQQLKNSLKTALELLQEMAEEARLDLDTLIPEEDKTSRARFKKEAEEHTIVRQARQYMERVRKWFESEDLKRRLGDPVTCSKQKVENLEEIEQVILWYHAFICVKLTRAVKQELTVWPASPEDMPKDSDGSAKVALIAIDRSLAAWWQMRGHFPQRRNQILDFLIRLDGLLRATEGAFPKARSFLRPGLDKE